MKYMVSSCLVSDVTVFRLSLITFRSKYRKPQQIGHGDRTLLHYCRLTHGEH
jgi:hypothetical protein